MFEGKRDLRLSKRERSAGVALRRKRSGKEETFAVEVASDVESPAGRHLSIDESSRKASFDDNRAVLLFADLKQDRAVLLGVPGPLEKTLSPIGVHETRLNRDLRVFKAQHTAMFDGGDFRGVRKDAEHHDGQEDKTILHVPIITHDAYKTKYSKV